MGAQVAKECLAYHSRSLARTVTRLYDDAMRKHGLTVGQFNVLAAIGAAGPIRATSLGQHLNIEKSTLSRNLNLMHRQGWVKENGKRAGRVRELTLTASGKQVLEAAFSSWVAAQLKAKQVLSEELASALIV